MKALKLFTKYTTEKDKYKALCERQTKIIQQKSDEINELKSRLEICKNTVMKNGIEKAAIGKRLHHLVNHKGSVLNTQKSFSCKGIKLMLGNIWPL